MGSERGVLKSVITVGFQMLPDASSIWLQGKLGQSWNITGAWPHAARMQAQHSTVLAQYRDYLLGKQSIALEVQFGRGWRGRGRFIQGRAQDRPRYSYKGLVPRTFDLPFSEVAASGKDSLLNPRDVSSCYSCWATWAWLGLTGASMTGVRQDVRGDMTYRGHAVSIPSEKIRSKVMLTPQLYREKLVMNSSDMKMPPE